MKNNNIKPLLIGDSVMVDIGESFKSSVLDLGTDDLNDSPISTITESPIKRGLILLYTSEDSFFFSLTKPSM
ncbi:acyltransferase [Staphylococcus aureus]|nr:acyltransferase [Staphylococcus aureus]